MSNLFTGYLKCIVGFFSNYFLNSFKTSNISYDCFVISSEFKVMMIHKMCSKTICQLID